MQTDQQTRERFPGQRDHGPADPDITGQHWDFTPRPHDAVTSLLQQPDAESSNDQRLPAIVKFAAQVRDADFGNWPVVPGITDQPRGKHVAPESQKWWMAEANREHHSQPEAPTTRPTLEAVAKKLDANERAIQQLDRDIASLRESIEVALGRAPKPSTLSAEVKETAFEFNDSVAPAQEAHSVVPTQQETQVAPLAAAVIEPINRMPELSAEAQGVTGLLAAGEKPANTLSETSPVELVVSEQAHETTQSAGALQPDSSDNTPYLGLRPRQLVNSPELAHQVETSPGYGDPIRKTVTETAFETAKSVVKVVQNTVQSSFARLKHRLNRNATNEFSDTQSEAAAELDYVSPSIAAYEELIDRPDAELERRFGRSRRTAAALGKLGLAAVAVIATPALLVSAAATAVVVEANYSAEANNTRQAVVEAFAIPAPGTDVCREALGQINTLQGEVAKSSRLTGPQLAGGPEELVKTGTASWLVGKGQQARSLDVTVYEGPDGSIVRYFPVQTKDPQTQAVKDGFVINYEQPFATDQPGTVSAVQKATYVCWPTDDTATRVNSLQAFLQQQFGHAVLRQLPKLS